MSEPPLPAAPFAPTPSQRQRHLRTANSVAQRALDAGLKPRNALQSPCRVPTFGCLPLRRLRREDGKVRDPQVACGHRRLISGHCPDILILRVRVARSRHEPGAIAARRRGDPRVAPCMRPSQRCSACSKPARLGAGATRGRAQTQSAMRGDSADETFGQRWSTSSDSASRCTRKRDMRSAVTGRL